MANLNLNDGGGGQPSNPTRAVGTAYQPNANRPTLVMVTMNPAAGSAQSVGVSILMDSANPPTTEIGRILNAQSGGTAPPTITVDIPITFLVPAGFYYKINNLGGTPPVSKVTEWTL